MLQRIQSSMDSLLLRPFSASAAAPLSKHPFQGNNVEVQFSNCQPCKIPLRTLSRRYQECRLKICMKNVNRRYGVVWRSQIEGSPNDTSDHHIGSEPEAPASRDTGNPIQTSLDALYRFSRPHTVIGTATSIISVSLLAVETMSDISLPFFIGLLKAIVAALFMNIYIVGLNQLFDIEIDKINKPYLPLASGEFSVRTGVTIISISAIMSFGIGWIVGSWPLFWALSISFVLGTAYSINLPMLRWKRFAVVAAMCILAVRAVIVQLAFFLHMQTFVFRRPSTFSRPLIFATAFMSFFSVVIALFKDIPDIDGDRIFGIKSFSVRLGQKRVFWICVYLLQMAYTAAVVIGASSSCIWSKLVMVVGHILLALILWVRAKSLDLKSKAAITSFYMFIWKLFYAEYLLIPLVR